jgi:hypothetical protein
MKKLIAFILSICYLLPLQGEILQVIAHWNAFKCMDSCTPRIRSNFSMIPGVSRLQINSYTGTATIDWAPLHSFSYQQFYDAAAAAGIQLNDISLRVQGRIAHDPANIYLISDGDQMRFMLVGPLNSTYLSYRTSNNIQLHPLPQEMIDQLLAAEDKQQTVIVYGALLAPRKYPNALIVQQLKVLKTQQPEIVPIPQLIP